MSRVQWLSRAGRLLKPSAGLAASLIFAALVAWAILGSAIINPRNVKWLKGDPAQSYLGWAFFRAEKDWSFPLGYTSRLNFPFGTAIAYTDSIPIVAAAIKPFSGQLPSTFQYLGLVAFANYILQAFFGYKIGLALFKDRLVGAFSSAFFTLAPPFVLRTGYHFSLSSQWLILASLWLYIRFDRQESRASEAATVSWFCLLFFFAGGVTPYLAVTCLFVWLATGLLALARNRQRWLSRVGLWLVPVSVLILSWTLFGFLRLDMAAGYAAPGYRYHSLNILAPIDPQRFPSLFFKDQGVLAGQTEGYAYLGAGVIFMIVAALVFSPFSLCRSKIISLWPLWLVAALSFVLALSAKVTLGPRVLLDFPLPDAVERLFSTFRASGRLFWTGYYILLCCSLIAASRILSRNRLLIVLGALLIVQVLDCRSLYADVRQTLHSKPRPTVQLKDPFWKKAGDRFDALVVLPAWQTQFRLRTYDAPAGDDHWRVFGFLAARQKMAINTAYLTRQDPKQLEYHSDIYPGQICAGQLEERILYILSPRFLVRLLENNVSDVVCQTVDGVAVGWKASSKSEENRQSVWNALEQNDYSISLLDRFAYHPHEVTMDLRDGFLLPEGELFLTDGRETKIPLVLDKSRPVKSIHVDLTPLNIPDGSSRQISISIGEYQVDNRNLTTRSSLTVEIPGQVWTEESTARRIVPLVFKWGGPISAAGAGDLRPAAAAFRELRLEY